MSTGASTWSLASWARGAATVICVASCGLTMGCAETGAQDTRRELLANWSTELIVSTYATFETEARALDFALDDVCAEPSEATVASAREAWDAARGTFKQGDVFAFGPYSRPEFRIGPHIDSWPARPDDVEELLAGTSAVDGSTLSGAGVYLKGLPVIEYLLYPPLGDAAAQLADARRCEYLRGVGDELVARAEAIHTAWSPDGGDFAGQLSGAGRTSTAFRSLRDAFSEVVNRMGFLVENVRKDKLSRPVGDEAGGVPEPALAESRFSGRSVQDIQDNLSGIEVLYFGDDARGIQGLRRYASERGADFDDAMRSSLDASRAALDLVDLPLTRAVVDEPDLVRAANAELGELQSLLQVDVIGALGLTLTFNDNDGD